MARKPQPRKTSHGRKPPAPKWGGTTRSTFDGCAVVAVALAGMVVLAATGVGLALTYLT